MVNVFVIVAALFFVLCGCVDNNNVPCKDLKPCITTYFAKADKIKPGVVGCISFKYTPDGFCDEYEKRVIGLADMTKFVSRTHSPAHESIRLYE
ncbi:unnamed protein product [Strongylus vulgaris]|uniref:Uncharacterized protein n=1 Tax=Strongylus vulgaris TaxID=40348 RepID=A0A3P7KZR1_STRVU|nr:unnamed protein product [Strongylus vulgaris]